MTVKKKVRAKDFLFDSLADQLLSTFKNKNIDLIDYMAKNVFIKDLRNNIVSLKINAIQRAHHETKKERSPKERNLTFYY